MTANLSSSPSTSPSGWDRQIPELTFPPLRIPPVEHHVQLISQSPSSSSHNGSQSTPPSIDIEYDLLNRHLHHLFVSGHGPQYNHHQLAPSLPHSHQYLSHQPVLDFSFIRSDYLTMITTKSETNNKSDIDVFEASPEFNMDNDFSAYLTSPLDDSPLWEDDMLTTPSFGSNCDMGVDILTSPALIDSSDNFGDLPLFPDADPLFDLTFDKLNTPHRQPPHGDGTPSFDPVSLQSSPDACSSVDQSPAPSKARSVGSGKSSRANRRKITPTGTRKNVTPDSLVPVEAPIQPRKYSSSSATSRKELPAIFARKRKRSLAFGVEEEEDQLMADVSSLPPTPIELDAIEAKRRQNTLAARRSRRRKLEHQKDLETALEGERKEKEAWKNRATAFETLLRDHGIQIPVELEGGID